MYVNKKTRRCQHGPSEEEAQPAAIGKKSMGSAVTDAAKATMTAYGQKLAQRARVDMDAGKPE